MFDVISDYKSNLGTDSYPIQSKHILLMNLTLVKEPIIQAITRRNYTLNVHKDYDSNNLEIQLVFNIVSRKSDRLRESHKVFLLNLNKTRKCSKEKIFHLQNIKFNKELRRHD